MAPGAGNLFARVFQWLANEVIVKSLANNHAFQRFAVRSSQHARDATRQASDVARALTESETLAQLRSEGEAARQRAQGFATALREELEEAARQVKEEAQRQVGGKPPPRG
jgi:hypothetical protein